MLQTAYLHNGPAMVRYPRGSGPGVAPGNELSVLPIGRGEIYRQGRRVALLAFGSLLTTALEAAETLDATVANMRFIKPLDEALVFGLAAEHDLLVTLEENVTQGGAGSAVNELLAAGGPRVQVINLGLPDHFIEHATAQQQLSEAGLDVAGVLAAVTRALGATPVSLAEQG